MPPLQPPLTQPAYTDMHAILTHYEAKEAGLGHRIANRLRDKLQRGALNGNEYTPNEGEGCLFCTVAEESGCPKDGGSFAQQWAGFGGGFSFEREGSAENFVWQIRPGMTPENSAAADALDAAIEDWLHIQEATLPASSVSVVAQGMTPRDLAALKAEVAP